MRVGRGAWVLLPLATGLICAALGADRNTESYTAAERRHWSFRPRAAIAPPAFEAQADRTWAAQPIDAFVLQRLRKEGLSPAPEADKRTLVRRVYLDVTGLPPTPAQIQEFIADVRPDAWERLVDRLLASPEYADRQAQHWLDVVRFAESDGFEYDTHRSDAWQYRDYVIRSFAADKPYDRFVQEQLAGDEIDPNDRELLVAATFNRLGPYRQNGGNQDAAFIRNEVMTEMTNIVGSAFLGVTLGCARCHDHKFDPVRQKDYYRIQGFFATTHHRDIPLSSDAEQVAWKAKTEAIKKELAQLKEKLKTLDGKERADLEVVVGMKEKTLPEPLPALLTVESKPDKLVPVHVLNRGNYEARGEQVGMRPLGVLLPDGAPEWNEARPRLALAKWITAPDNPLTARVIVNRIWLHHFGAGLVATPNDFGRMGTRPSHPELLDWLANEFVRGGMKLKPLHRMMLLSRTYRQAFLPEPPAEAREKDLSNRFLWHYSRRRLDADQLRDSMLAVSGLLNPKKYGPGVMVPIEQELLNQMYKPTQWMVHEDQAEHRRRSIYLFHKRNMRLPFLEVFDAPDTLLSCARRESSTHAPQALELLNGDLTQMASQAFAERLKREAGSSPEKQVNLAFELAFGRPPSAKERTASLRFLKKAPLREFALALFAANDFLYAR